MRPGMGNVTRGLAGLIFVAIAIISLGAAVAAERKGGPTAPVTTGERPASAVIPVAKTWTPTPTPVPLPDLVLYGIAVSRPEKGKFCQTLELSAKNWGAELPESAYSASATTGAVTVTVVSSTRGSLLPEPKLWKDVDTGRRLKGSRTDTGSSPLTITIPVAKAMPVSQAESYTVTLDAGGNLHESHESNNILTKQCECD